VFLELLARRRRRRRRRRRLWLRLRLQIRLLLELLADLDIGAGLWCDILKRLNETQVHGVSPAQFGV
jgi:hypothetical protein